MSSSASPSAERGAEHGDRSGTPGGTVRADAGADQLAGPGYPHRGQGPRQLRGGRPPRHRRQRPDQLLRRGRRDDPVQGPGPEPAGGLLVRADRRHRPQPHPRRARSLRVGRTRARGAARRVRLPGVPDRRVQHGDLEGLRAGRAPVLWAPAARRAAQAPAAGRAPAHTDDEGREGRPRRADLPRGAAAGRRDQRGALRRGGAHRGPAVRSRARVGGRARSDPRRHQVRDGPRPRRYDRRDRRGPHARLLALLVEALLRASHVRGRRSPGPRQGVRPALARRAGLSR